VLPRFLTKNDILLFSPQQVHKTVHRNSLTASFCLSMTIHGMSFSFGVYGLGLLVKVWFVFIVLTLLVLGHLR
jgi:hypothetical protein